MEDTLRIDGVYITMTPSELATVIEACRIARGFLGMVESTIAGAAGGAEAMYRDLASISLKARQLQQVPASGTQIPVDTGTKRRKK